MKRLLLISLCLPLLLLLMPGCAQNHQLRGWVDGEAGVQYWSGESGNESPQTPAYTVSGKAEVIVQKDKPNIILNVEPETVVNVQGRRAAGGTGLGGGVYEDGKVVINRRR